MSGDDLARYNRRAYAAKRRADLRARAVEYLGGACRICGYNKSLAAFDFHHVDPQQKDFNISQVMSWERIVKELDKCELLCSNCHREVHDGMHPDFLDDGYDHGGGQYDTGWTDDLEGFDS